MAMYDVVGLRLQRANALDKQLDPKHNLVSLTVLLTQSSQNVPKSCRCCLQMLRVL